MKRSPIAWIGGKQLDSEFVLQFIPEHVKVFSEPFAGGLSISFEMLAKERVCKKLIINDLDTDLINFWKAIKDNTFLTNYPIITKFEVLEKEWEKIIAAEKLEPWQFFLKSRLCWGSRVNKQNVTLSALAFIKNYHLNNIPKLAKATNLFNSVKTEFYNTRYDLLKEEEGCFYYFDPPYCGVSKNLYKHEDFNYLEFNNYLRNLKGKWLLSMNDTAETREIFKEWNQLEWEKEYSMRGAAESRKEKGKELLIANYPLLVKEKNNV